MNQIRRRDARLMSRTFRFMRKSPAGLDYVVLQSLRAGADAVLDLLRRALRGHSERSRNEARTHHQARAQQDLRSCSHNSSLKLYQQY